MDVKTITRKVLTHVLLPCVLAGVLMLALPAMGTAFTARTGGLKTFYVDTAAQGNQVYFLSEASLEDFTSIVNRIGGDVRLDPKHLETLTSRFFFDLTDLKTGLSIRDKGLRGPDWFDTDKYPRVELVLRAQEPKKTSANTADITLVGTCTVHGVTQNVRIPATLAYLDESPQTSRKVKGDLVRIRGGFDIKLSDYGVNGPRGSTYFIGVRVADVQKVRFTVFGSTHRPDPDSPARKTTASAPA